MIISAWKQKSPTDYFRPKNSLTLSKNAVPSILFIPFNIINLRLSNRPRPAAEPSKRATFCPLGPKKHA